HHAPADFWMAIFVLFAGPAERDIVQDRDVILNNRGLTDHQTRGVVEENTAADFRGRIDVALEYRRRAALEVERKIFAALSVQPVRETMRLNGVETFVIEHRLYEPAGRRITVDSCNDIGAKGLTQSALVFERIIVGLTDQVGRHIGMGEPLTDAMRDGCFERVVMEDILVDESRELRLAARDVLRLAADTRPDRIDFIEAPRGPCLKLSHIQVLRLSAPLHRSFSTISKPQREPGRRQAHGSPAPVKEIDNTSLINLVANSQHMVAARYIERRRAWNKRGQFMAISGDLIFRADGNQYRRENSGNIGAAHLLTRAADTGSERAEVRPGLLCEAAKHLANRVTHIVQRWRLQG